MGLAQRLNDALVRLIGIENRIDPWLRPLTGPLLEGPVVSITQKVINRRRPDLHLGLAEEHVLPGEEEAVASIIESMSAFTVRHYARHLPALRAGNAKTYGAVRARFEVLPGLDPALRKGVLAEERSYPAWVRFASGPALAPPDIDNAGVMSVGVKLMDVRGEKLLDERYTQDFTGITTPTFTTADVLGNAKLQRHLLDGTPLFYFLDPADPHLLEGIMSLAYAKTQASPLQAQYYSCTPYLLGSDQAMQYSLKPASVPAPLSARRLPWQRFPADYLRQAMAETLRQGEVVFDFTVQVQTDPHAMPVEDASVIWPLQLSPRVPVARLVIPGQQFDSSAQMRFAESLSYNPWHCVADHRPLGNQNRARRAIYTELSALRHRMNDWPQVEPTGDETFD
jgi:hypothetical protein